MRGRALSPAHHACCWRAYNAGMPSSLNPDLPELLLAAFPADERPRLCVAFSGGLDSSVLLHVLAGLRARAAFELSALHVHHGLSPCADDWAAHCEDVCRSLGVPLRVATVRVARAGGKGLEAAAREARHAEFEREPADWMALAHHLDDQAETLLHRLVRGAGVAGAAAMRECDPVRRLWRPLLSVARADLLDWAEAHALRWIEDESNEDQRFSRNFLRHDVMPRLRERFPAATRNLAGAAMRFAESAALLEELGGEDLGRIALAEEGSRSRFRALSGPRQRNLLRCLLQQTGELAPDSVRTQRVCTALCGTGVVREVFGGHVCCAWRDRIWVEPLPGEAPQTVAWRGERRLQWGRGWLECEPGFAVGDGVSVAYEFRSRKGGECLSLGPGRPRRSLQHLCQDAGIPAWWRDELPLLWRGDELVWVAGVGAAPLSGLQIRWIGPDGVTRG